MLRHRVSIGPLCGLIFPVAFPDIAMRVSAVVFSPDGQSFAKAHAWMASIECRNRTRKQMRHVSARIAFLTVLLVCARTSRPRPGRDAHDRPERLAQLRGDREYLPKDFDLKLNQRGDTNGISSIQMSGEKDAQIFTHQRGHRNTGVIHQSGWITISRVIQEGPHGPGGYTNLPT